MTEIFPPSLFAASGLRRGLLIRRQALGDCLVSLEAVRQLVAAYPRAHFDLVIDRPFAPLIRHLVPEVEVLSWPGEKAGGELAWYRFLHSRHYDLVVDWLGVPRTALWTMATGAPWRVGYDLPRRRWAYNLRTPRNQWRNHQLCGFAGEAFLDPLRVLGLDPRPWQAGPVDREIPPVAGGQLRDHYRTWRDGWLATGGVPIALMMSATWPAKAWVTDYIAELINRLRKCGLNPLFIPGPGDGDLVRALEPALPREAFAPATNLMELTDLLGHCAAFVGTDCGARHLAAFLGLPTVTIFGPTDALGWNPADPRHVAVQAPVDCLGCNQKICPLPGHPCMQQLHPETVSAALVRLLERQTGANNDS